jgi:thiol-disulfide isomerase/thioredoxin
MNNTLALIVVSIAVVSLIGYNFTAYAEQSKPHISELRKALSNIEKSLTSEEKTNPQIKIAIAKLKSAISSMENAMSSKSMSEKKTMESKTMEQKERTMDSTDLSNASPVLGSKNAKIDKSGFKKAPELRGITGYINTSPDDLKEAMKNKVVLYDFWTYSCYNCQNTFPYVKSWHEKYSDKGLVIVGIHYPEFQFERDINNVRQAVTNNDIKFPVILDNDRVNWDAFGNRYWPRFYLADSEGYIRYNHIGEGAYDETENMIKLLLKENNS